MNLIVMEIIAGLLILFGTFGALLPVIPGLPISWIGLLIFAASNHFSASLIWGLVVFGILVGLTMILDIIGPGLAASGHKASKLGVAGATLGAILGVFVLGPIGILLGPFIGSFAGEMLNASGSEKALKVAMASMLGFVIGTGFKLIVGASMFIYFLVEIIG